MAIAHDAATESATFTTTSPATISHPAASSGVVGAAVFVIHGTDSTDRISGVTYGGVAMARIATAVDTATEAGRSYVYFLGSGLPQGTQTVSITHDAGATVKIATVVTVTGVGMTEVVDSDLISENTANPQVTLDSGGRTAQRYCGIYSGLAAPSDLTILGTMSALTDHDFGAFNARVDRQTTPGSGAIAIGYTSGADDVALVALAIAELVTSLAFPRKDRRILPVL